MSSVAAAAAVGSVVECFASTDSAGRAGRAGCSVELIGSTGLEERRIEAAVAVELAAVDCRRWEGCPTSTELW